MRQVFRRRLKRVKCASIQRVVILNTYSWLNKGDSAIVLGTARVLQRVNPDVEITIVSQTPEVDREPYAQRGIGVVSGPFGLVYRRHMNRLLRWALFGWSFTALLAGVLVARLLGPWAIGWWRDETGQLARDLTGSDLVISCGGGFWHDSDGGLGIRFHLMQLISALVAGRPVVCLGQSLGPFRSRWKGRLVGAVLNRTAAVVLREKESIPAARAMGIGRVRLNMASDMAFALAPENQQYTRRLTENGRVRIGVTARAWWFPGCPDPQEAQTRYEQALITTLDRLIEQRDAEIVFLPQVTGPHEDDDRIVQQRIAGQLRHPERAAVLNEDLAPEALIQYIGGLDFVIATRFHSAILTMLANVPVIAIAYEHKTTGIMGQMGLSRWVTSINNVTAPILCELCDQLADEYDRVKEQLAHAVKEASERVYESAAVCVGAVNGFHRGVSHAGEVTCSPGGR